MRALVPGHVYELYNHENPYENNQKLRFITKEMVGEQFKTIADGTTNEEVLKMLIDRLQFLQNKAPCRENAIVITKLEESLMWLEKRTADRKTRGVEGTPAK